MKKKKLASLIGLALALAGATLQAQTLELTVDSAVELSLKNSLTLKAHDFQLAAKRRSRDLSWNAFIPKTSIGAGFARTNDNPLAGFSGFLPSSVTADTSYPWSLSASLTAQLNITLALFDGIHHTVLDYQAGLIGREQAERRLVRDVKKAFYNQILIRENIATFEQQIETARRRFEKEKRNFAAGTGSEFSMLSAQVGLENMLPVLEDLRNGYQIGELSFKQMLGIGRSASLSILGSIDVRSIGLDAERLIDDALAGNPSLLSLRAALDIQKNLKRGRFNQTFTPVLSLAYSADPTFGRDPFRNAWFGDISNDWKQRSGLFSVFLSLPLDSLLPFSGTGVELSNQDELIGEMETQLQAAARGAEVQILSLVMNVEKSRRAIERLELNIELAGKAFQMAEKGYETGAFERLEVEDADNKLREARLRMLAEKYTHLSSLFDLEFETGRLLAASF